MRLYTACQLSLLTSKPQLVFLFPRCEATIAAQAGGRYNSSLSCFNFTCSLEIIMSQSCFSFQQ